MHTWKILACRLAIAGTAALMTAQAVADEFTQADLDRWQAEYLSVVAEGDRLFHGGLGNENTVSCDQCHPNASNTHPETYPRSRNSWARWRYCGR
jgi:hypothetical protein